MSKLPKTHNFMQAESKPLCVSAFGAEQFYAEVKSGSLPFESVRKLKLVSISIS